MMHKDSIDPPEEDALHNLEPLPFLPEEELAKKPIFSKNKSFRENSPVYLLDVKAERQSIQHLIHPYIYTIKLRHFGIKWEVNCTYKELKDAHKALCKLVKSEYGIRTSEILAEDIKPDWPLFPTQYDGIISESEISTRCVQISEYLKRILTYPIYRDHPAVSHLLLVSHLSFTKDYSPSIIEGLHCKRESRFANGSCRASRLCCDIAELCYGKRWICLKDTYIVYLNPAYNNAVGYVVLIDSDFECKLKTRWGAYFGLEIKNQQRKLFIRFSSNHIQDEWFRKINSMLTIHPAKSFFDQSPYDSFAPPRNKQLCRWFLNASDYMRTVMNGLNNAKQEIFITDWWLTPELFLIRPTDDLKYRLDKILLEKARQGVKVYILLYKEIQWIVQNIASLRARDILTENGKNPNIMVLRHPGQLLLRDNVFLWSHHEKCVIIDQSVAFMGGIDLCFGRYDDDEHRLIDLGSKPNIEKLDLSHVNNMKQTKSESNIFKDMKNAMNEKNRLENMIGESRGQPDGGSVNVLIDSPIFFERSDKAYGNKNIKPFRPTIERSGTKIERAFSGKPANRKPLVELDPEPERPSSRLMAAFSKKPTVHKTKMASTTRASPGLLDLTSQKTPPNNVSNRVHHLYHRPANSKYKNKDDKQDDDDDSDPEPGKKTEEKTDGLRNQAKNKINDLKNQIAQKTAHKTAPRPVPVKWARTKKELLENNKLNISIGSAFSSRKQKSTLEDDFLNRGGKDYVENLAFEDLDLPKISDSGYYYWIGKDYSNVYHEDIKDIDTHAKDQLSRDLVPRMPWRDQAMMMLNESARDMARHFIQRWNQTKNEQCPALDTYPYLMPKSYMKPLHYDYSNWLKDTGFFRSNVQIVRSADDWSAGIKKTEHSIMDAYLDLISQAQHFIYIENQFFITTTNPAKDDVKNTIGLALVDKITEAHKKNKSFKVYVCLPLLPGFDKMNAIKAVQYYNLRSIKFGQYSIYKKLKENGVDDPTRYISFHGMRNWCVLMGKLVQEIIYVHSKLMIVDDRFVICGSANINDRSMLGRRDSELAAVIRDEELVDATLNGKHCKVGRYATSLRKKIFKLHLGIAKSNPSNISVNDCASDSFYRLFRDCSHQNTMIYEEVFKCLPSDSLTTFKSVQNNHESMCLNKTNPAEAKLKLEKCVKGFVVDFPLLFLSKEKNFFPDFHTAEGIVPHELWT